MMRKAVYILIAFSVMAGIISACANQPAPTEQSRAPLTGVAGDAVSSDTVIAEGHLEPARDTILSFQSNGMVVDVAVKIGDTVKEGDVLARLGGESDGAY